MDIILKSVPTNAIKILIIVFYLGVLRRTCPHRKIPHLKIGWMVTTNDLFHEREHKISVVSAYIYESIY
jgi:hypothetical protein